MGKRIALASVLVLAAAGILATRDYDASELGGAALDEARASTGLSLEASDARFQPLRGLELVGVRAAAPFPGGRYEVAVRRLRLEHRLGPLLRGRVDVERVVLVEPRVVLTVGREPPRAVPPREPSMPGESTAEPKLEGGSSPEPPRPDRLAFSLGEVRIEGASFAIRDRSESPARLGIEGLDLELDGARFDRGALTLLHGIAGGGRTSVSTLRFARTEVTDLDARLEAEGGRYALSELSFETAGARFEASRVELDFNTIPFRYRLELRGRGDLPEILGGGAVLRLDAEGFGTSSRALSGEGVLELAAGSLPDTAWARSLDAATDVELVGRPYAATRMRFRVESNRIVFEPFRLEAASYLIEAEGEVDLEGSLAVRLTVAEGASSETRFRLSGTFAAPELEPDGAVR